jgi:DNA polymerase I
MSSWILDIEADDLLLGATRMHILCLEEVDTGEVREWLHGDEGWREVLAEAEMVVGHNIEGYDIVLLERLFGFKLTCPTVDTLLLSQIMNYRRFNGLGHSLENWGLELGYPKIDWRGRAIELELITEKDPKGAEFKTYHPEMSVYCKRDVSLNRKVYDAVMREYTSLQTKNDALRHYVRAEHYVSRFCARARMFGWPFDKESAEILSRNLEVVMNEAYDNLSANLGWKCVPVDKKNGVYHTKFPKWTKQGCYDMHTANWFGVDPYSGVDDPEFEGLIGHRQILGEYSRVEFKELSLDSVADVKIFLYRHGWEPTDWNYKKEGRTLTKTTPKITEDSLEFLGGNGKLYTDFLTAKSRHGIVKTWLLNTDSEGNLHGDCRTIGTPSMRATHSIIVNVPSGEINKDGSSVSAWGPEMRALFRCRKGWKLVGCDSKGNQARGLAHHLGDEEYIDILLHGDIHQYNADKLTLVLKTMGISSLVPRSAAKRIFYAFLFGASGAKLWSYIFGMPDSKKGNKLKKGFVAAVPGFAELVETLEKIFGKTKQYGYGYIPSVVGNRIYVDSFHKLLVYLLQAMEKVTCSAALMLTVQELEKREIPYVPLIFMHDEIDLMVPEEYADEAAAIGCEAFREGPKLFGVTIMDGDSKVGNNWREIH